MSSSDTGKQLDDKCLGIILVVKKLTVKIMMINHSFITDIPLKHVEHVDETKAAYSIFGESCTQHALGNLILAGNFNITNNEDLFGSLVQLGQHPRELSDTVTLLEKIGHFVDKENNDLYVKYSAAGHSPQTCFSLIAENINIARILRRASSLWDGGYCIAGLLGHGDSFVMRDPSGIRPAFYYADDEFIVVCSEAPLIQTVFNVNGDHVFPLPPGQALCIKRSGAWTLEQILAPCWTLDSAVIDIVTFS